MRFHPLALICLSFIAGLLASGLDFGWFNFHQTLSLALFWCLATAIAIIFVSPLWRRGPTRWQWLLAGMIALVAGYYGIWRTPQPGVNDISLLLDPPAKPFQTITAIGTLDAGGRENAQGQRQFLLTVEQLQRPPEKQFRPRSGTVYLTLPGGNNTWQQCQQIRVTGLLYRPSAPQNPGAFNFAQYLARQGIFAGLKGEEAMVVGEKFCGLNAVRQRIVNAQTAWLPAQGEGKWPGLLISSIVLGAKAVNLPTELRNLFQQVGLSHFLAASGYQVSLLVGTVLLLGKKIGVGNKLAIAVGLIILAVYLGLTGLEPSVIRASLLWAGVMTALASGQKLNTVGALLAIATVMLLVNPVWSQALGFQLSFLATLGIVAMVPPLQRRLDFLPGKIAGVIAVPLAASIWTTPILLQQFGYFIPAALPLNILITPLLGVLSLGGMVSALFALIFPPFGSATAWLLAFPARWLMAIAAQFQQFPRVAVGELGLGQVVVIYGAFCLIWAFPWWRRRWIWIALFLLATIIVPLIFALQTRVELTIFDSKEFPILVAQAPNSVTTFARAGDPTGARLLTPFLAQKGINEVDCPLNISPAMVGQPLPPSCGHLLWVESNPAILQLEFGRQRWWIFLQVPPQTQAPPQLPLDKRPHTIIWAGQFFPYAWLDGLRPPTAIAIAPYISRNLKEEVEKYQGRLWVTGAHGAVQWRPHQGFSASINP
ncbi:MULTISPECIES: ComEC/Rec2 family competence protein [unclassified Synechocystis]|uniref:ComEC/Rec2 family competence protein n=1 Tax=unclassified Synechocystis TaxID=2640012 RepID=UPI0004201A64|nr:MULTISPECIES: ComEC/Rec2 family competence protein [unclassified Synechocystis]AIE74448.1 ComEC/Rec2-related protein [Synechocystis sp. PCC 6714]MCT0254785.1 competence protein ComEC family protein [Synechocystis sp. CS-94]